MSRQKRDIYDELIDEVRRSQNATARFDQAVADALGLNRTDMRCRGRAAPGGLADRRAPGGADRAVERRDDDRARSAGARRLRAPGPRRSDRRRVLVELTAKVQGWPPSTASTPPTPSASTSATRLSSSSCCCEFVRENREFNEPRGSARAAEPGLAPASERRGREPVRAAARGNCSSGVGQRLGDRAQGGLGYRGR